MTLNPTAEALLDAAQELVQDRGFNAFSYKDLAASVGIRTASIHYHFPAKADLGKGLIERYLVALRQSLGQIDSKNTNFAARLRAFIALYRKTENQGAICLCGSMASDWNTLDPAVQQLVGEYLNESESWVAQQIRAGMRSGEFSFSGKPKEAAASLIASLQGGLMLARAQGGPSVLSRVQSVFLTTLTGQ